MSTMDSFALAAPPPPLTSLSHLLDSTFGAYLLGTSVGLMYVSMTGELDVQLKLTSDLDCTVSACASCIATSAYTLPMRRMSAL